LRTSGFIGRELAEVVHAFRIAPFLDDRGHPLAVRGLDADAAFPLGIEESLVARGDLGALDLLRVVADHEEIEAVGIPGAMRRDSVGGKVAEVWRMDLGQQLLLGDRFHLGPLVSTTSTVWRLPCASVITRCTTLSESARHSSTFTPYFFSKASASGSDSWERGGVEAERPLLRARSTSRMSRSAPRSDTARRWRGPSCPRAIAGYLQARRMRRGHGRESELDRQRILGVKWVESANKWNTVLYKRTV
jgi:hypothetical protein